MFGRKQKPRALPLQFELPPEWTDADALSLSRFMGSIPGNKLHKILVYDMCNSSVMTGPKSEYEQGVVGGMNHCLAVLRQLGQDDARQEAGE